MLPEAFCDDLGVVSDVGDLNDVGDVGDADDVGDLAPEFLLYSLESLTAAWYLPLARAASASAMKRATRLQVRNPRLESTIKMYVRSRFGLLPSNSTAVCSNVRPRVSQR